MFTGGLRLRAVQPFVFDLSLYRFRSKAHLKGQSVNAAELLRQLSEALERAGVAVRHERLGGEGGGICRMRGQYALFIDLDADTETQIRRSVAALSNLPNIDSLYLPPQIREQIERD